MLWYSQFEHIFTNFTMTRIFWDFDKYFQSSSYTCRSFWDLSQFLDQLRSFFNTHCPLCQGPLGQIQTKKIVIFLALDFGSTFFMPHPTIPTKNSFPISILDLSLFEQKVILFSISATLFFYICWQLTNFKLWFSN